MINELIELPEGWEWFPLEFVADAIDPQPSHRTPAEVLQGVPYVGIGDINDDKTINFNKARKVSPDVLKEHKERYSLRKGDFIFGKIGTLGKPFKLPEPFDYTLSANVILLQPKRNILSTDWLFYFMKSSFIESLLLKDSRATSQAAFGIKKIRLIPVPVPPLNEQRRIVAKIEALKARSQRVKEELEAIPVLLDQFRQSVLAATFRGDLTADWREKNPDVEPASVLLERIRAERRRRWEEAELEKMKAQGNTPKDDKWKDKYQEHEPIEFTGLPDIPDEWCWLPLEALTVPLRPISYGILKPGDFVTNGIPMLRITDLQGGSVNTAKVHKVSEKLSSQYSRTLLTGGEIVISLVGSIGLIAEIPKELCGANIHRNLGLIAPNEFISSRFLFYWLNSTYIKEFLRGVTTGANQPLLNLGDVKRIPIPVPTVSEQITLTAILEQKLAMINKIQFSCNTARQNLTNLNQSILAKAFRGELVLQDPNDEPASILLERIRAEQEKLDTKKKAKGKTEKKSHKAKPELAEPKQLSLPGFE